MVCRILSSLAAFALTSSLAWAQSVTFFELPEQSLAESLRAVAKQTNTNVMFDRKLVGGKTAPAVKVQGTLDEVLGKLLSGTGIRHEFLNEKTVTLSLEKAGGSKASKAGTQAAGVEGNGVRVARVEEATQAMRRVEGEEAIRTDASGRSASEQADEEESKGTPELLVKGRRSLNSDIKRTEDDVQPYMIFEREQIERSMATSVEDFLTTRLTAISTIKAPNSETGDGMHGNRSKIELRGLSSTQTLILVNGRRMPSVSPVLAGGGFNQPDINGIPLAAIERIEVLPTTASGIYGGGAVGGVINIILRQDYAGVDVRAAYNNSFDTDSAKRTFDLTGGFSLEGGKTDVSFMASYSDSNLREECVDGLGREGADLL